MISGKHPTLIHIFNSTFTITRFIFIWIVHSNHNSGHQPEALYLMKGLNMEGKKFIAIAGTEVSAPVEEVWNALTDSTLINKYLIDTTVKSTWEMGSDITWEGDRDGTPYKDYGKILAVNPNKILSYSHFCPLSGREDVPENYHNIEIELMQNRNKTTVILTQDNNRSERSRDRSEKNWNSILAGLKKLVEGDITPNEHDFLSI